MALIELEALIEGRVSNDPVVIAAMCAPAIDAIRAAGGCYCRECRCGQEDDTGVMHCHKYHIHKKTGGYCDDGEAREVRGDG